MTGNCDVGSDVASLCVAFAEPQRPCVTETLQILLVLCEAVLLSLSNQGDQTTRPKFVQLCQQLGLSKKVWVHVCVCVCVCEGECVCVCVCEGRVYWTDRAFYERSCLCDFVQEVTALQFVFMHNVGVLFNKVRHVCVCVCEYACVHEEGSAGKAGGLLKFSALLGCAIYF